MADFYGTVAAANAYHTAHGNAEWTGDDATKTAALLVASEWIDANYGDSFSGYPTGKIAQVRQWPRTNAYDKYDTAIGDTDIPVQVEQATYEVALRQIAAPGSLFVDWTKGEDVKSLSIDGAISLTFAGASSSMDAQVSLPKISAILAPLFGSDTTSNQSGRSSRI